jgi:dTDP-4-amino-4,6-dideoxygalactose transaminase
MIPQNNPLANYLAQRAEIDEAVRRVLEGGRYILSEETARFEKEFSVYIGTKYAVGTGNGTEALHLALCALDVGRGDEVITVSHTAVATVAAIELTGALPVLIDVDPSSYTMNPELLERVRTKRTKAVVPVHLYGQPCELEPVLAFAKRYSLRVIEDCAQSHGAWYKERRVGSWGDAGTFSFYPTKNLGCLGDGGAVTTNDEGLYTRLLALRQYGWDRSRMSQIRGFNSRLDELQAAILRVKLAHLEENNQKRKTIAHHYNDALAGKDLVLPPSARGKTHVYHQYVVRCPEASYRNALAGFLGRKGVQTAVHYPTPVHLQPAYLKLLCAPRSLPVTEEICQTILSLPMFPELKDDELASVSQGISEFIRGKR